MLHDHENHRNENESADCLADQNLGNEVATIVTAATWAQLRHMVTVLGNLLSITLFLEYEATGGDEGSNDTSDTLGNNNHNREGEVPHPVF